MLTCAAALRHAGVSQTLGASWALVRGQRAAKTIMMININKMMSRRLARIKSPRDVTPNRPPAF